MWLKSAGCLVFEGKALMTVTTVDSKGKTLMM
jgi:hypothetical protein